MRIPTMSALVMSLCACSAADAQPNVSIERIHQAGFVDAIGLEVIDAQHLLVADTTGSRGSSHVWKITLPAGADPGQPGQLMPAFVSAEDEFVTLPMRQPAGLGMSVDQQTLYVCDMGDRRIFVCDATTGQLTNAIDTPGQPRAMRTQNDGSIWYLTTDGRIHQRRSAGKMTLLRDARGERPEPFEFDAAFDLAIQPSQSRIYVSRSEAGQVIAVNTKTSEQTVIAADLDMPRGIECVRIGEVEYLIIAEAGANRITLISLDEHQNLHHVTRDASNRFQTPLMVRRIPNADGAYITARNESGAPILLKLTW